jgi:hypothetical protein
MTAHLLSVLKPWCSVALSAILAIALFCSGVTGVRAQDEWVWWADPQEGIGLWLPSTWHEQQWPVANPDVTYFLVAAAPSEGLPIGTAAFLGRETARTPNPSLNSEADAYFEILLHDDTALKPINRETIILGRWQAELFEYYREFPPGLGYVQRYLIYHREGVYFLSFTTYHERVTYAPLFREIASGLDFAD